jgi:DUF1009 family protein
LHHGDTTAPPRSEELDLSKIKRIGLIAGWGRFPIVLAETLKAAGREVVCLGVPDHADPCLKDICDVFRYMGLGKFGKATNFFHRHGVRHATMAGKFHKIRLYDPGFLWRQAPDFYTIRFFATHFLFRRSDCKDDSLLMTVVRAFENRGVTMAAGVDFAPELLVERQLFTKRAPTPAQWQDILFGWKIAREMGRLDIGQSVYIKNRAVLAVEAIEGTDEAIKRAGTLCKSGKFVIVKVAKPFQDMRFDVPTVGPRTIRIMAEAGAQVLAIEAKKTIFLDPEEAIKIADAHKISIVALIEDDLNLPANVLASGQWAGA